MHKQIAIFVQKLKQKSQLNILDNSLGDLTISSSRKLTFVISNILKLVAKALIIIFATNVTKCISDIAL